MANVTFSTALTLIGLDSKSLPPNFHKTSDAFDRLELANQKRATDIVELLIRNSELLRARPG